MSLNNYIYRVADKDIIVVGKIQSIILNFRLDNDLNYLKNHIINLESINIISDDKESTLHRIINEYIVILKNELTQLEPLTYNQDRIFKGKRKIAMLLGLMPRLSDEWDDIFINKEVKQLELF